MSEHSDTLPPVATRQEWLAARMELLAREKEVTRARDAVAALRHQLPMVKVEKGYVFHGPRGRVSLEDLFEGRPQLLVYHFMWVDDRDEGCPSCSMLVDTLGDPVHVNAANTSVAVVSRAPFDKLEAYRQRMGWARPLHSSAGSDFNYDFQATIDAARGAVEYNFRNVQSQAGWEGYVGDMPGASVFLRHGGEVYHTYSTYARGTESLTTVFSILDLTPLGRQEEDGIQSWVRHRDRYQPAPLSAASCCGGAGHG